MSKHTPDKWMVRDTPMSKTVVVSRGGRPNVVCIMAIATGKKWPENAEFIAEAGTVAHETGLTPRGLVDRIRQLEQELSTLKAQHEKAEIK